MRLTTRLGAHRAIGLLPARHDPVDVALRGLTTSANHGVLWFSAAAAGVLVGGRFRRAAIRGTASLAVSSFVANTLIKPLVGRRRPDVDATELARRIVKQPWTSSFPSGHSASAFAFAVGATVEKPVAGVVLLPLAAAVAYSRVHVGVHFATDVAAGAAIGAGIALAGRRLWPVKPHTPAATAPATAPALPGGEGLTIVVNRRSAAATTPGRRCTRCFLRPASWNGTRPTTPWKTRWDTVSWLSVWPGATAPWPQWPNWRCDWMSPWPLFRSAL